MQDSPHYKMSHRISKLLLGVAIALLLPSVSSMRGATPPDRFDLNRIDSYLSAEVQERGRVGLSVAILKNRKIILAKGYGVRSLQEKTPVEPDTMFAIGSITKQFTCACVLLLAEEKKLSVHDKVSKYLPKLTRATDVTLLDLMDHTSGYPDYYPLDFVDRRMQKPISADELIQKYAGQKLDFAPGTEWSYSNTGFIILGRVVETACGQSFAQFLQKRILSPLQLTNTTMAAGLKGKNVAQGYTSFALSGPEPVTPEAAGWIGAAGELYSTASDLAKWDMALIEGKVLKPNSYKLMTTARELPNGIETGYGCGLGVAVQEHRTVLRHSGAVSGFNAYNAVIPSTKSAVVLLCNKDEGLGSLPDVLTSLLLKAESNVPQVSGLSAVETVKKVFAQLQAGAVDRSQFGDEFNVYMTDEKLAGAAQRLKRFGNPKSVEVTRIRERGGMEVTTTSLIFDKQTLEVLMYRAPQGRIEEFFIDEK